MIDARRALNSVLAYGREFSDHLPFFDPRLEEIEEGDDGGWLVTLSTKDAPFNEERTYRRFRVNGETGEVKSMKRIVLEAS